MFKKRIQNWGLTAFIVALSIHSIFAAGSPVVTNYGEKSYYLSGDPVEIATWKNGAVGAYTSIHDDWGSTTLGNVYKHLDSISLNRGIVTSSAAISGSCDIPMTELAKKFIRHGHEIHSHSVTHTNGMSQLEIVNSRAELEDKLGVPVQFYVFPFDQWDDAALGYVESAGYLGARAGDRQPYIDAAVASGTIPNLTNPKDFSDPYRVLFDVYPRSNSGYKNVPDNGDPVAWLKRYAKDAVDNNSWAIHEFHDISSANNLCIPIDHYRSLMDYVGAFAAKNELWTSGPTEVIRYRFTREYCGDPLLTSTANGYSLAFGTPKNISELQKFKTSISVFFKTTNMNEHITATQDGEVIPSFKVSDNYFSVYVDPTKGNVSITASSRPWAKYPFLDPQDTTPSEYDAWNAGSIYQTGAIVYHQGKEYRAKWWAQDNNPLDGDPWTVHNDISNQVAVASRAADNGSISPAGKTIITKGNSLTYSITPDAGYAIDYVNVDMVNVGPVSSYTFSNLQKSHTIEAVFTLPYAAGHTITASASNGGSISPNGNITVAEGGNSSFSATANAGYQFDGFLVDGILSTTSTYSFTNVTEDHTIIAQFSALPDFTITATANIGGTISPEGAVSVPQGQDQTFTIDADENYIISDIAVNGYSISPVTSSYTFTNVTEDQTITASFEAVPFYSINASVNGNGSISPSGTSLIKEHDSQTYEIVANPGNRLVNLVVDGVEIPAASSYTFNDVVSTHSIVANFEEAPTFTINAVSGNGGSISPNGATTVTEGGSQSYTISADIGYTIDSVIVDGAPIDLVTSYTFENVTANHSIEVRFKINSYTIAATFGSNGSIDPVGLLTVLHGGSGTYTITPDEGYQIDQLLVNSNAVTPATTYTFNNVTSNQTIDVTFKNISSVQPWNANDSWTSYSVGDRRSNGGFIWECTNVAYSFYEPSGAWGHFGWKKIGPA